MQVDLSKIYRKIRSRIAVTGKSCAEDMSCMKDVYYTVLFMFIVLIQVAPVNPRLYPFSKVFRKEKKNCGEIP
jgi:hypothetical protein